MGCLNSKPEGNRTRGVTTRYVSRRHGDYETLSEAVQDSKEGDIIVVLAGSYVETQSITINKGLTIVSATYLKNPGAGSAVDAAGGISDDEDDNIELAGDVIAAVESGVDPDMSFGVSIVAQRTPLFNIEIAAPHSVFNVTGINFSTPGNENSIVAMSRGLATFTECEFSGGNDIVSISEAVSCCDFRKCVFRGSSHAAVAFVAGATGHLSNCQLQNCPTGMIISNGADPHVSTTTISDCGTGVLVRDGGMGIFAQCTIENNSKPGVIIASKSNPVFRHCIIRFGESNGIFVRDDGRGVFTDCAVFGNGLPGVATCTESCPIMSHCTIRDGRNAGILVYDNGRGIINDCSIHDNHMPGIEVRAGGHPIVSTCEIFNGESNGVYIHNRGKGVFSGCRVFENVLPGIAIRTSGNPVVAGCSIITGKDNAVMVCDKGRGVIVDSSLHGLSARPLEVRDGCDPVMANCEIHDGKHRHVLDWLEQLPKGDLDATVREQLGWTPEGWAELDKHPGTPRACKESFDGSVEDDDLPPPKDDKADKNSKGKGKKKQATPKQAPKKAGKKKPPTPSSSSESASESSSISASSSSSD